MADEPALQTSGKPTLAAVANRAGVSLATASRALAGTYPVAKDTMSRVLEAAGELNYQRSRGTHFDRRLIAVVGRNVRQDLMIETVAGLEGPDSPADRFCLLASTHGEHELEMAALDAIISDPQLAGVVVAGGATDSPQYRRDMTAMVKRFAAREIPFVFCGRSDVYPDSPAMVVDYDRVEAAASATSLLLSQGHRKIACIRGPRQFTTSNERTDGYRKAMASFGAPVDESLIRFGNRERATGYAATKSLIADGADFTAVFCDNDDIAIGCLAAARECGLTVPDDLSVVGFDDHPMARETSPGLTTVHLPFDEIGRAAAKMALDPPPDGSGRRKLQIGTHLVIRGSTRVL